FHPALFCFHHPASPLIPPLSLHDALPILFTRGLRLQRERFVGNFFRFRRLLQAVVDSCQPIKQARIFLDRRVKFLHPLQRQWPRSEEHTSELQSLAYLVCRLLLEKKNLTI